MKNFTLFTLFVSTIAFGANGINTQMVIPSSGDVKIVQSGNDKELLWVDEQIQAILPARIGVADGYINTLLDPMKYHSPVAAIGTLLAPPKLGKGLLPMMPKVVEEPLRLQALLNKSVLINGKWYKLNDSVRSYTVAEIKSNSVLLTKKKGQSLLLILSKTNNNITINTK